MPLNEPMHYSKDERCSLLSGETMSGSRLDGSDRKRYRSDEKKKKKKKVVTEDYAHHLQRKEIITDFLNEFCEKESYVGEVFDITPKKLLDKFVSYLKKRKIWL